MRISAIAILAGFAMLTSCEKKTPPPKPIASANPLYDPGIKLPDSTRISDDLPHAERVAIVLRRVADDVHALESRYQDERVRILLELIAGDTGIEPQDLDIRALLKDGPTNFDELNRVDTVLKAETLFNVELPPDAYGPKAESLSIQSLVDALP